MALHTLERAPPSTSPAPAKAGRAASGAPTCCGTPTLGFCGEQSWDFTPASFAKGLCSTSALLWHRNPDQRDPSSSVVEEQWCGTQRVLPGILGTASSWSRAAGRASFGSVLQLSRPLPGSSKPSGQLDCSWKGTQRSYLPPPGREGAASPSSVWEFSIQSSPGLQSADSWPGASVLWSLPGVCWVGVVPRVHRGHPERSHVDILVSTPRPSAFVLQDAALTKANGPLGQCCLLFLSADLIRSAGLGYKALIYWST